MAIHIIVGHCLHVVILYCCKQVKVTEGNCFSCGLLTLGCNYSCICAHYCVNLELH